MAVLIHCNFFTASQFWGNMSLIAVFAAVHIFMEYKTKVIQYDTEK